MSWVQLSSFAKIVQSFRWHLAHLRSSTLYMSSCKPQLSDQNAKYKQCKMLHNIKQIKRKNIFIHLFHPFPRTQLQRLVSGFGDHSRHRCHRLLIWQHRTTRLLRKCWTWKQMDADRTCAQCLEPKLVSGKAWKWKAEQVTLKWLKLKSAKQSQSLPSPAARKAPWIEGFDLRRSRSKSEAFWSLSFEALAWFGPLVGVVVQ